MNRSTCTGRPGSALALLSLSLLFLSRPLAGANLISCTPSGAATDPITRAFYVPNYPGVNLRTLTLNRASDTTGRFVLTLTAHLDTFDGAVLGSATTTFDLTSGSPTVPVTFLFGDFAALPMPKGSTVAFVVNRQGTGPEVVSFATGSPGGCGAVETNDATPPLGAVRGSVPLTVAGDVATSQLATNATFDSSVAGWTTSALSYPTTIAFDSADADGSGNSGSALVTNVTTTAASSLGFAQGCVPNTGPGTYSYGGKIRANPGQSSDGSTEILIAAFPTPDCSGAALFIFDQTPTPPNDGQWHAVSNRYTVPAGKGYQSVAILLVAAKNSTTGTFAANFDDVFVRPAQVSTLTVPGAASIHGQAGAFFHTDLWVFNRSYSDRINVTATFRCFAGRDCGVGTASFGIAPRQQILYQDVLKSLLNASETAGALELSWDASFGSISASARTYSPSLPAPTTGTGEPALASSESRARAVFTGLSSNGGDLTSGFRSNVGAYNPSSAPANVTLTLFDDSGQLLGSTSHAFAGFEAYQFNDIFAAVGKGTTSAQKATLVLTSNVPVFSYATVIDNQTNDPSFLLPSNDEDQP